LLTESLDIQSKRDLYRFHR